MAAGKQLGGWVGGDRRWPKCDTGSRKLLVDGRRRASIMPESSQHQRGKERE